MRSAADAETPVDQMAGEFGLRVLIRVLAVEVGRPDESAFLRSTYEYFNIHFPTTEVWGTYCWRRIVPRVQSLRASFGVPGLDSDISVMVP